MSGSLRWGATLAAWAALATPLGCTVRHTLTPPDQAASLEHQSRYLKAHLRDGGLVVLREWSIDEPAGVVRGFGQRYDVQRRASPDGPQTVAITEVALFETNAQKPHEPTVAALTVVSGLSALLTAVCAVNPKTCFGSCPTFYVDDGGPERVAAEGFSDAIAPSLEHRDVDALYRARPKDRALRVRVTNEALETHVVRRASVLAARRPPGGRVVATAAGDLVEVLSLTAPVGCAAGEGSCLAAVAAVDDRERTSRTDGRDLAAREEIELRFPASARGPGGVGLVLEARQTLLTTFLFYQALAYLGRDAVPRLAEVERGDSETGRRARSLHRLLGGIEVLVPDERGGWKLAGSFDETGPIASDVQLVRLPGELRDGRVKLRIARGHYRIGYAALATLGRDVQPVALAPTALRTIRGDARAAEQWRAGERPFLVTGPGDAHELTYELPGAPDEFELFLDAQGYYLEWMRAPWLEEEDHLAAAMLFGAPSTALRRLAPAFHRTEDQMEALFWKSRYVVRTSGAQGAAP